MTAPWGDDRDVLNRLSWADVEPCDEYDPVGNDNGPDGHPYCDCGWARDLHTAFLRMGQL